jgi:hypothetical protein
MDVVGLARILGLEATLAEQNGVIRRDQAQATGLTRNRVDDLVRRGRWVRALPAVYALPDLMGTVETRAPRSSDCLRKPGSGPCGSGPATTR